MTCAPSPLRPNAAEVQAQIDLMDREEPNTRFAIWRPPYQALTTALNHARKIRMIVRGSMATLAVAAAIILHRGDWTWNEARDLGVYATLAVVATEFTVAKIYPVLWREQRVVSLLRYFGSAVQEEEAFS